MQFIRGIAAVAASSIWAVGEATEQFKRQAAGVAGGIELSKTTGYRAA